MSRIDDLIAEHCPDGVEFRPLGGLGRRNKGTSITAGRMKELQIASGPIRVFAGGNTVVDVDEKSIPSNHVIHDPSIIVKSRGHIGFTYYDRPFTHKSELWSYTIDRPDVEQKFVYYYLLTRIDYLQALARATSVKLPQLGVADTDRLPIPVPPIEVQREIVRILDTFTQLEAELEAELEARRIQYAHYRNSLLQCSVGADWRAVGEVADVTKLAGYEFTSHVTYVESGETIALRGLNVSDGRLVLEQLKFIDGSNLEKLTRSKLFVGDMLFTYVGTVGQVALVDKNNRYYLAPNVSRIRFQSDLIDPQFMLHYFRTDSFIRYQIGAFLNSSSLNNLTMASIRKFRVPIPPLEEQRRLVEILDRFETLTNDLSIGLPAELEARRKQYAYYRDKLLTFRELPS